MRRGLESVVIDEWVHTLDLPREMAWEDVEDLVEALRQQVVEERRFRMILGRPSSLI